MLDHPEGCEKSARAIRGRYKPGRPRMQRLTQHATHAPSTSPQAGLTIAAPRLPGVLAGLWRSLSAPQQGESRRGARKQPLDHRPPAQFATPCWPPPSPAASWPAAASWRASSCSSARACGRCARCGGRRGPQTPGQGATCRWQGARPPGVVASGPPPPPRCRRRLLPAAPLAPPHAPLPTHLHASHQPAAPLTIEAAHKKGSGSTKNGRDSQSKRRGVKVRPAACGAHAMLPPRLALALLQRVLHTQGS